jgi:hypothetical protein
MGVFPLLINMAVKGRKYRLIIAYSRRLVLLYLQNCRVRRAPVSTKP